MTPRRVFWSLLLAAAAGNLCAQTPNFEVASIRVMEPPFRALRTLEISGNRATFEGWAVRWLVAEAFGVKDYQVGFEKIPGKVLASYYRIDARAGTEPPLSKTDLREMLRGLMQERFHLAVHWETRTLAVYALVADKKGPILKTGDGQTACKIRIGLVQPADRNYRYQFSDCTLEKLADTLPADRPIVDRSQLTGQYDFEFFATPEFKMQDATEPGDIRFLDAVRKLGLRLEPREEPVKVVVVDHVDERPVEN